MIVTRRIALRIALIVLVAVILQLSFFSYVSIAGAVPNAVAVVIVALGLLGGAVTGATCGFAAGLLLDSLLLQTLGVSSLVLLSVGYLAGRYREGFEIDNTLLPALLAGAFTLVGSTAFAALQLMLGVDAAVSLLVVREIFVQSLLSIVLGFAIYPLVRRIVAPALIDYVPARRLLIPGLRRSAPRRAASSASRPLRSRLPGGRRRGHPPEARRRSGARRPVRGSAA